MAIAKIEDGVVVQVDKTTDNAPEGWETVDDSVVPGMRKDGDGFIVPPVPAEELLERARTAAYTRITQGHADALAEIDSRYPLAEKLGWNRLDKSLDKYHAEGAITPGLQLYADQLGVSVADAAARLDGAIDVYDQAYHDATGKLTRLRDAVDAAETVEEYKVIQW